MSEAAEGKKKKGGKLPMIIALVAVLGGGGFFMMKGKEEPKEKPAIELGEIVSLGEFLVNLADGGAYLRTEISVHVAKDMHLDDGKGGDGHGKKADPPAPVRDAVIEILSSRSMRQISTPDGRAKLRKDIAAAINKAVPHHEEEKGKEKDKDSKKKKKSKSEDDHHDEEEIVDETWDNQHGPVLKVYFTNFATQQ
jgi:flagellar basal body-associated protein FliL